MTRERGRSGAARRLGAGLALAAVLAGCGAEPAQEVGAVTRPPAGESSGVVALPERQAARDGMITIEGMTEPKRFNLYRSPDSFPLAFSTYLPDDVEAAEAGEGEVRFVVNYTGTPNPAASLRVRAYPEGLDEAAARAMAEESAAALGTPLEPESGAEPWARAVLRFRTPDGATGRLYLGEHEGRYFEIVRAAPVEMAEGFGPRAEHVLDEWRWEDTGEGLRREIRY